MPISPGILCVDRVVPSGAWTSPAAGNVSGVITLSINAADNDAVASVQFRIDGVNIGAADTVAPYSVSYDTRAVLNGPHTLSAVITDRVGNQTTITQAVTMTNVPVVTITAPLGNVGGVINITANVTSYDASISVQFKVDGANLGGPQTAAPFAYNGYDTRALLNGVHTFSVVATDGHGNQTTTSVSPTFVNVPVVQITAPNNGASIAGTWNYTATVTSYDASCSTQFKVDGGAFGGAQGSGPGAAGLGFGGQDSRSILNGPHTLTVTSTDGHGNVTNTSIAVTVANLPVVAITAPVNNASVANVTTFSANVTSYDASINTVFQVDGGQVGATQGGAGAKSVSVDTRSWLNGWHTWRVISTDGHGNQSSVSYAIFHSTAPVFSYMNPGNGANVSQSISFNFGLTHYASSCSTQLYIDGGAYGGAVGGTSGGYGLDTHYLSAGWHTFTAIATDAAGIQSRLDYSVYIGNVVPATGYSMFGDKMVWYDDGETSGYFEYRTSPGGDPWGGGYYWSNVGEGGGPHPYISLPGNPDPTHYQMYASWQGGYVEGGSDGNVVHLCFTFFGANPGYEFFRNGDTGINLPVNGGEYFTVTHWQDWENNTVHTAGVGVRYWFAVKSGYAS